MLTHTRCRVHYKLGKARAGARGTPAVRHKGAPAFTGASGGRLDGKRRHSVDVAPLTRGPGGENMFPSKRTLGGLCLAVRTCRGDLTECSSSQRGNYWRAGTFRMRDLRWSQLQTLLRLKRVSQMYSCNRLIFISPQSRFNCTL